METNPSVSPPQLEIYESQIRECYGRVIWTHKTQEKCADILDAANDSFKFWQTALTVITTSGILTNVFAKIDAIKIPLKSSGTELIFDIPELAGILAAVISVFLLGMNIYAKKYDFGAISQKHADAASAIWNIREKYLSLLADIRAGVISIDELRTSRDKLQTELHKIYKGSPRTISKAYAKASKALKQMEEMTLTDDEIDKFLPRPLRKNQD